MILQLLQKADEQTVTPLSDKLFLENNSIGFDQFFPTFHFGAIGSTISLFRAGGCPHDTEAATYTYHPAWRYFLLNKETKNEQAEFIKEQSEQEWQLQSLKSLAAVQKALQTHEYPHPTVIIDTEQWLVNNYGPEWRNNLPVRMVPNSRTAPWFGGLIQFELSDAAPYATQTGRELPQSEV